jgi:hypothetical protein
MDKLQHIKHKHEPQLLLVFRRYDSGLGQVHVCRYGTSGFHACRLINGMSRNFFPNATAKPQHTTTSSTMESLLPSLMSISLLLSFQFFLMHLECLFQQSLFLLNMACLQTSSDTCAWVSAGVHDMSPIVVLCFVE